MRECKCIHVCVCVCVCVCVRVCVCACGVIHIGHTHTQATLTDTSRHVAATRISLYSLLLVAMIEAISKSGSQITHE